MYSSRRRNSFGRRIDRGITLNSRTILRSYHRSNVAARELLSWVFASELLNPSSDIWIAVAWISDVMIVDSTDGSFDAVTNYETPNRVFLSDFIVNVAKRGTSVKIVTRPDVSNQTFVNAVKRKSRGLDCRKNISILISDVIHQKNIVGNDWVMDGSMNLTANGLDNNVESLSLYVDPVRASETRTNLYQTWSDDLQVLTDVD